MRGGTSKANFGFTEPRQPKRRRGVATRSAARPDTVVAVGAGGGKRVARSARPVAAPADEWELRMGARGCGGVRRRVGDRGFRSGCVSGGGGGVRSPNNDRCGCAAPTRRLLAPHAGSAPRPLSLGGASSYPARARGGRVPLKERHTHRLGVAAAAAVISFRSDTRARVSKGGSLRVSTQKARVTAPARQTQEGGTIGRVYVSGRKRGLLPTPHVRDLSPPS